MDLRKAGSNRGIAGEIRTGKKVAIIGSGPSGLGLCRATKLCRSLGLLFTSALIVSVDCLMYGIPNMKLDKAYRPTPCRSHVCRGCQIHHEHRGRPRFIRAEKLKAEFDAIVLCCGATKARDLPIPGRELDGIHFAMDFLHFEYQEPARFSITKTVDYISAKDKECDRRGGRVTPALIASVHRCDTGAKA